MSQVVCPQCGKEVDPSEGYCVYCGYTFDDGAMKSPFASSYNQSQADVQFEETSGGSPVIRFDASSMDAMDSYNTLKRGSSGELMFGIGMCRILAILFAVMTIISTFLPYVTFTVSAATKAPLSKSLSSISAGGFYLYLMIAACIVGIIFAIKGKPVVYLICGIASSVLALINYFIIDSSVDIAVGMTTNMLKKAKVQSGINLTSVHGPGFYFMVVGAIGMIAVAIAFFMNHDAYDN